MLRGHVPFSKIGRYSIVLSSNMEKLLKSSFFSKNKTRALALLDVVLEVLPVDLAMVKVFDFSNIEEKKLNKFEPHKIS